MGSLTLGGREVEAGTPCSLGPGRGVLAASVTAAAKEFRSSDAGNAAAAAVAAATAAWRRSCALPGLFSTATRLPACCCVFTPRSPSFPSSSEISWISCCAGAAPAFPLPGLLRVAVTSLLLVAPAVACASLASELDRRLLLFGLDGAVVLWIDEG